MNNDKNAIARRSLLLATLALPVGACTTSDLFGSNKPRYTLSPRGDRLVFWIQRSGRDSMLAPEATALMGITNEGGNHDIPVRQIAQEDGGDRFVVSLTNIRKIHDLIFMRRQGDVLLMHLSDTKFQRLASVRYPRNGKPSLMTDTTFAENDFQQQIAFWFRVMPGR